VPGFIHVVLIEDCAELRECLELEINRSSTLSCVASFPSAESALSALPALRVDVVLLDLGLPGMGGIECCEIIKRRWPRAKVLIFSGAASDVTVVAAFAAGADGYILKSAGQKQLACFIFQAHVGGWPMSPGVREVLATYHKFRHVLMKKLSPIEQLILEKIEEGKPQKEIADVLSISLHTVKTHIKRILEKSGASSAVEAGALRRSQAAM
jgi:DNA-binding NarL/FixJ family response regulator